MKNVLASKTVWLGLLVAVLPWVEQVKAGLALDPKAQTAATVLGMVVIVLRMFTSQPLNLGKGVH